jgi:hypothetical protein
MGERRFVIYEIMQPELNTAFELLPGFITETELLRRFYGIRTMIETGQNLSQLNERAISILLHGEKEQNPVPVKNDTDATSLTRVLGINKVAS